MLSSKQKLKRERAENAIAAIMHATEALEDKHFYNRAILLWQGVNKNERDRGANLISQDEYSIEDNRINKALLLLIDDLPYDLFENQARILPAAPQAPPPKTPSNDFWKKLGYVGLIVGILAGVVKIVEYFQKPSDIIKAEKTTTKPDSLATPPNISTSGDQSPAINAPGGDVQINYEAESAKSTDKKAKN